MSRTCCPCLARTVSPCVYDPFIVVSSRIFSNRPSFALVRTCVCVYWSRKARIRDFLRIFRCKRNFDLNSFPKPKYVTQPRLAGNRSHFNFGARVITVVYVSVPPGYRAIFGSRQKRSLLIRSVRL